MRRLNLKENYMVVLLAVTAVLITVPGVIFKQSLFRILPLYVSLFISLLMSRMNRYAPLMGGINSILYAVVYAYYSLWGSAGYAIFVSCPVQIVTFIRWSRHSYANSTVLRKMSAKGRILMAVAFVAVWCILYAILSAAGSAYIIFDNTITLFGLLNSVLMALSFVEYTVLMIPAGLCTIGMYISMTAQGVAEQTPYLVYSVFSLICVIKSVYCADKLLKEQAASRLAEK